VVFVPPFFSDQAQLCPLGVHFNPHCGIHIDHHVGTAGVASFDLLDQQKVAVVLAGGICTQCRLVCLNLRMSLGKRKRALETERIALLAGATQALGKEIKETRDHLEFKCEPYPKKIKKDFGEVGETERRSRLQHIAKEVFQFACMISSHVGDQHHCPLEYVFASSDDQGHFTRYRIEWADVYSPVCALSEFLDEQEKLKVDELVHALDVTMTSREGYRQLAAAEAHMTREFVVSAAKGKLTEESMKHLPLQEFKKDVTITSEGKKEVCTIEGVRRKLIDVVNYGLKLYPPKRGEKVFLSPYFFSSSFILSSTTFLFTSRLSSRFPVMGGWWASRFITYF